MARKRGIVVFLGILIALAFSETNFDKAVRLYREGKHEEAIKVFKKVLEEEPQNAQASFNIGYIYQKKGKAYYPHAIKWYKEALKKDPKLMEAYFNLGVIFVEEKNYEEAKKVFEIAYQLRPGDPDVQQGLREVRQALAKKEAKPAPVEVRVTKDKQAKKPAEEKLQSPEAKLKPSLIKRFLFCKDVQNREPAGISDKFSSITQKIFVFIELAQVKKESKIKIAWIDPQHNKDYIYEKALEPTGGRYRFWMWRNCQGYELCSKKGDWTVEVYLNEVLLSKKNFLIE